MKNTHIFENAEIINFINAVKIGGLKSDAFCNAFDLLESDIENGGEEILQKYDSLSQTAQKEFRQLAYKAEPIENYEDDDDGREITYDLTEFDKFKK